MSEHFYERTADGSPGVFSTHSAFYCPYCGKYMDSIKDIDGHGRQPLPENTNFTVCFGCTCISVIVIDSFGVHLRKPTDEELGQIPEGAINHAGQLYVWNRENPR